MSAQAVRFAPQTSDGRLSSQDQQTNIAILSHIQPGGDGHGQEEFEKQKIGHRRVDKQGEVSYKRVPTNALMGSVQLGIANAVGSLASVPVRDILITDFYNVETVAFPSSGSQLTPAHSYGDFRFQAYAPIAFRYFRELFNIETADFLRSICFEPLQELSNPGASGSIFYVTSDERFIIKTVQHNEADFLQSLLPSYFMNLKQNPLTLLPKFFGFFCYQKLGKNIRLIVMNNLLPQSVTMHEKYDLKGSTYKRYASKSERAKGCPTLKDLDFIKKHPEGFFMEADRYDVLLKTLERDCLVLQSCKIMDYSLLVGVHRVDTGDGYTTDEDSGEGGASSSDERTRKRRSRFWDKDSNISPGVFPARNYKGQDVILFLGIIDILQKYRFFKKFEHTWKSLLYKADSISVHNPSFYAERFQKFMQSRFFHPTPATSAVQYRPVKQRLLRRITIDKEKDEPEALPLSSHTVQINVVPPHRLLGRRSYYGQEATVEKPQKKKVERLFAPEPELQILDRQECLSEGDNLVRLSRADMIISSPDITLGPSSRAIPGDSEITTEVLERLQYLSTASEMTTVDATRQEMLVEEDREGGNFVTRIYIPPYD